MKKLFTILTAAVMAACVFNPFTENNVAEAASDMSRSRGRFEAPQRMNPANRHMHAKVQSVKMENGKLHIRGYYYNEGRHGSYVSSLKLSGSVRGNGYRHPVNAVYRNLNKYVPAGGTVKFHVTIDNPRIHAKRGELDFSLKTDVTAR